MLHFHSITALFNNTRTLKLKAQPTNAFFAAVNQVFRRDLPAYDYYRALFVVWTLHNDLITARLTAVESWEEPANINLIDGSEKCICQLSFEF